MDFLLETLFAAAAIAIIVVLAIKFPQYLDFRGLARIDDDEPDVDLAQLEDWDKKDNIPPPTICGGWDKWE